VQAICKWYQGGYRQGSYKRERDALEVISQGPKGEGRDLWPRLLSINHDQHVLLTQPLASPPGALADHTVWSRVLCGKTWRFTLCVWGKHTHNPVHLHTSTCHWLCMGATHGMPLWMLQVP
jgi:hypothetical protein